MSFEFDAAKSERNKEKHGIDFNEAQLVWTGDTVQVPLRTLEESRVAVIGMIGVKHWTVITTLRGQNIRIISARRARKNEVELYEQTKRNQKGGT